MSVLRIYRPRLGDHIAPSAWPPLLMHCRAAGFGHVLLPTPWPTDADADQRMPPTALLKACRQHRIVPLLALDLQRLAGGDPCVCAHPEWFRIDPRGAPSPPDPRAPPPMDGNADARWRWRDSDRADAIDAWWREHLDACSKAGAGGFLLHAPQCVPVTRLLGLVQHARRRNGLLFIADTHGLRPQELGALAPLGLDGVQSSAPWWDGRAPWYAAEQQRLRALAPVLVPLLDVPSNADERAERGRRRCQRALDFAVTSGDGVLIDEGFARRLVEPSGGAAGPVTERSEKRIAAAFRCLARQPARDLRPLGAPHAVVGAWLRLGAPDVPGDTRLITLNADLEHAQPVAATSVHSALGDLGRLTPLLGRADAGPETGDMLEAGAVRAWIVQRNSMIVQAGALDATRAAAAPRIAIEAVSPSVDDGLFAAKRAVGSQLVVEADIFIDGHEALGAEVLWRASDEKTWRRTRLRALGNDRWRAEVALQRIGRHEFIIEAWHDRFAGARADLRKRELAGVTDGTDVADALALVVAIAAQASAPHRAAALALLDALRGADRPTQIELLLAERSAEIIAAADRRPQRARSRPYAVDVDRRAAQFAAWYELFPRSQASEPGRHGRFADVIGRLDAIKAMGFDVLYLPPIHPIGTSQRKGRNNARLAAPDDPGSVYAIGSPAGGHTALNPQLGTLADFRRLHTEAARRGLEIALDFAIQCSPDHPWLREHREWFAWRADGSVRHAENPPKRYEDIVNVDFYAAGAIPELWLALREVVGFWITEGITTFRVDNPHTKPMPFWAWLIGSIRAERPDVIFLAEAFTRPKPLRRLAKLGFNQSYTYFTWRNSKPELIDYITELVEGPEAEYLRPNFFANTPDINPRYLQSSGRAGFLVRAALAATLSGLWGIYSGFELCEADALAGREEYADSEKYQIRQRDWNAPGNIIAEIARLNAIRRFNPALHSHLATRFHHAGNDHILYYERATPARDNVLLVAVNLDPHNAREADIELPLWRFDLGDDEALLAEDLLSGRVFTWRGKWQHIRLDPAINPYAIWRIRAAPEPQ